jgi:GNAT superfamily N-acetyltransferase
MDLDEYTAYRLGCDAALLRTPGTHVIPAVPDRHEWLLDPWAAKEPEAVCLLEREGVAIVRTHRTPGPLVSTLVGDLPREGTITADDIEALLAPPFRRAGVDPYLYIADETFRPVATEGVRRLGPEDAPLLAELHAHVDPRMTWYVEIDHPAVFGRFDGGSLVAVASHFLFEEFGIAATGVLTHSEHRRRGHGTAVVSAAVAWALERGLVCEWITNETNVASLALARRLGFELHEIETEFRLGTA